MQKKIRHVGSIPGLGRSTGEGNGNILQYSYLENSMDRAPWWATVHRVAKSQTTELCVYTHYFGSLLNSIVVSILFFPILSLLKAHHLDGCGGLMAEISFVY